MFLNILVAYDGSPSAHAAFDQAVDIARTQNSKLTVTVAPPVSRYVALAGTSGERMQEDVDSWAAERAAEAVAAAPDDVIVHSIVRSGHAGPQIVRELEAGGYDLVVLGSRGHGHLESEVLRSVNAYVHFHSKVAMLSIDDA
jgi:nucleotide-binding universal stress UspA family protein